MRAPILIVLVSAALALAACVSKTTASGPGDPPEASGDPGGDGGRQGAPTGSRELCAAGGPAASASFHGVLCLSPVGSGGPVSSSTSYKLIPGPAHIIEAP